MTDFEKWLFYYSKNWATKIQLQLVVTYNKITPEQYEEITGEEYSK